MKKRILAVLLILCLTVLLLPTGALAIGPVELDSIEALAESFAGDENSFVINADVKVTGDVDTFLTGKNITVESGVTVTIKSGGCITSGLNNNGTIVVEAGGTLASTMGSGISNGGIITVEAGTEADLSDAGRLITWMGGKLHNSGTLNLAGAYITADDWGADPWHANYYVDENGTENVTGNGKVFLESNEQTIINAFNTTFGAGKVIQGAPIYSADVLYDTVMDDGYLGRFEQLRIMKDMTISSEIGSMNFSLIVPSGVALTVADGGYLELDVNIESGGAVTVQSGGVFATTMGGNIRNSGTITVDEGGEFDAWMGGRLLNDNGGTLAVNGAVNITRDGGHFENAGTIGGTGTITLTDNLSAPEDSAFADFKTGGGTLIRRMAEITDEAGLTAALADDAVEYLCIHGDVALTQDHTVAKDITMFDSSSAFSGEGRLTLVNIEYGQNLYVTTPKAKTVGLIFDLNGGTLSGFTAPIALGEGNKVTLPAAPSRSGYVFTGWLVSWYDEIEDEDLEQTYQAGSELTLSESTHNYGLTAQWAAPYTPPAPEPEKIDVGGVEVKAPVAGGTAALDVSGAALPAGESVDIDLSGLKEDVDSVTLAAGSTEKLAETGGDLSIKLTDAALSFDAEAVSAIAEQSGDAALTLSVTEADKSALSEDVKAIIGDAPVFELNLAAGGKEIHELGGTAKVSLPYTPKPGEDAKYIVIWRMVDGVPKPIACVYDAATGMATFETKTFSTYVVAYFPFGDVPLTAWYYADAAAAYMKGLMDGVGGDAFSPAATTTRGMIVTLLWRMEGEPAAPASAFDDVEDGLWYSEAVAWAAANGLVDGYDGTRFGPEDEVTREQLAAVLMNYAEFKGCDVSAAADLSAYSDAGEISPYAVAAMSWANAKGLVTGRGAASLQPGESAMRAEVAALFSRFSATVK